MGIFNKSKNKELLSYKFLYKAYSKKVYGLVFSLVKNHPDTKDIVQDTFITAFEKIEQLRDVEKFESWICSIACNKAKTHFRNSNREVLIEPEEKIISLIVDDKNFELPEVAIQNKETSDYLWECINNLDSQYREFIILFYYNELSYTEISKVLNINMNTTKSRLYRAKNKLKEMILNSKELKSCLVDGEVKYNETRQAR